MTNQPIKKYNELTKKKIKEEPLNLTISDLFNYELTCPRCSKRYGIDARYEKYKLCPACIEEFDREHKRQEKEMYRNKSKPKKVNQTRK